MVFKTRTSLMISARNPRQALSKFMRLAKKEKETIQPISIGQEEIPVKYNWKSKPYLARIGKTNRYVLNYYLEEKQ